MGIPMGGMGPMAGGPGGAGSAAKGRDAGRRRKVVPHGIPHTEDVTGRTDTDRLSAASAAHRDRNNPQAPIDDDPAPDFSEPVVRRLTTRPPQGPA